MYVIKAYKSVNLSTIGISIRPDWRWRGVYKNRNCEQVHLENQNIVLANKSCWICTFVGYEMFRPLIKVWHRKSCD